MFLLSVSNRYIEGEYKKHMKVYKRLEGVVEPVFRFTNRSGCAGVKSTVSYCAELAIRAAVFWIRENYDALENS